ncbi:uncharacterized protein F5147DRAFT_666754 [Suillus discolor]|uniref:Membrane anchor Opy2 N-terminal domain-containing protein n=1 Tax=Suillus discolor TaxID=1912936 RepID=A0A9P7FK95_9AGAM|nr:uncharacterized protein F5147DRAFT_666754 [Suillus discolor]KAG2118775.1 hypothetical protein F5147DRAFT_666754 [Suillus discolor]
MFLDPRQCVTCPTAPPSCTCSADQSCIQITRTCNACPTSTCQAKTTATSSNNGGVSSGALAGAVIAIVLVLVGALVLYFWYRRRASSRKALEQAQETKDEAPASAEAVLNRPDPTEKPQPPMPSDPNTVRVFVSSSDSVIDLDPQSRGPSATGTASLNVPTTQPNPFDDGNSIQTTSTGTNGTNVIPIALVSPGSASADSVTPSWPSGSAATSSPVRPARAPDLSLNDNASAVSDQSLRTPNPCYAQSQRSGSSRMSYMSNASYSSDFLNEAPMIITQGQGVRQVVGVVKAEVIQTSGPSTPVSSHLSVNSIPSVVSRPSIRSPLAASSFGPADALDETEEEHNTSQRTDPFGDNHEFEVHGDISNQLRPVSEVSLQLPRLPWSTNNGESRPSSISTQAGSIIDISSATRVNVGLLCPKNPDKSPRTTMGRLVSPASAQTSRQPASLEEQQQLALAHAHAQARAQGLDRKRISGCSVVSATSTRADSILESFPFVPPSPISSLPVRSPPRSPLHQRFSATQSQPPVFEAAPLSPSPAQVQDTTPSDVPESAETQLPPLDPPPSRRTLGLSTVSQVSTASSGLGPFPFQIDSGSHDGSTPPSTFQGRQRASLDTLALMSDLSSYPLSYDRDERESFSRQITKG